MLYAILKKTELVDKGKDGRIKPYDSRSRWWIRPTYSITVLRQKKN